MGMNMMKVWGKYDENMWPDFRKPSMYTHSWILRNTDLKY